MKNKLIIAVLSMVTIISLSACANTDVVGNVAKISFAEVLGAIPDRVFQDDLHSGW